MKAVFRTPDRVLLAFVLVVLIPALVYAWAIRPDDLAGNADFTAGQNIKVDSTGTKFETTAAGAGDVTSSMLNAATAASAFTGATNFATNTELTTATAAGTVSGTSIDWTSGITLPFIASISSAASAFLTGVTPTYVNTLTSNLQVQLNSKVSSSALNAASFIGTTDFATDASLNAATAAAAFTGTTDFATDASLNAATAAAAFTGTTDFVTVGELTLVTAAATTSGTSIDWTSGVTLPRLSGVTDNVQTQINTARGLITAGAGDFKADGTVPMTGNFLPGPTGTLNIGSGTSYFNNIYTTAIITSGSTDPTMTLNDIDNAVGTAKFYGNSSGGANDVTLYIGVEDSAGESTNYIVVSGVTEIVEILKSLKVSGVTTHNGSTGAGFIHIMEDADNGTDYSSITGGSNMGAYPAFHFSGSQGGGTLSLTNGMAGWVVEASGSTVTFTPNVGMSGNLAVTGQASGGAKTYSVLSGVTNATQLNDVTGASTLLAAEVQGTLINIDSSGVTRFTLPTPASGYNTIFTALVSGVTVQVESGTTMYVNGTATATNGVGAQIVSVTVGEYISCWTANVPNIGDGNGHGEIEWFCRKQED